MWSAFCAREPCNINRLANSRGQVAPGATRRRDDYSGRLFLGNTMAETYRRCFRQLRFGRSSQPQPMQMQRGWDVFILGEEAHPADRFRQSRCPVDKAGRTIPTGIRLETCSHPSSSSLFEALEVILCLNPLQRLRRACVQIRYSG